MRKQENCINSNQAMVRGSWFLVRSLLLSLLTIMMVRERERRLWREYAGLAILTLGLAAGCEPGDRSGSGNGVTVVVEPGVTGPEGCPGRELRCGGVDGRRWRRGSGGGKWVTAVVDVGFRR
ncbi:hypothetical protein Acr_11g0011470 [Actinidia rufa]|uniref:Uncharacterized protein n=1 Tax=Actinidia rufa TaxID=165716 RepID=A0A7J0FDS8_9ERIC|nr:hypothetical protein Acr_11g0011470 [Actinidia rufa]